LLTVTTAGRAAAGSPLSHTGRQQRGSSRWEKLLLTAVPGDVWPRGREGSFAVTACRRGPGARAWPLPWLVPLSRSRAEERRACCDMSPGEASKPHYGMR